jgi:cytoskeletal protein RodZ
VRVAPQESVGFRLRSARERRGLDLNEAAVATRIDRRFLEALEEDASPQAFPEEMYARAFLREYARYLGLRDRPLVEAYASAHPMRKRPPIGMPPIRVDRDRAPWGKRVLAGISVAAVATLAILSARAARGPDTAEPSDLALPSPAQTRAQPPATPEESETEPAQHGVNLVIRVAGGESWIRVTKAGEVVFQGTQASGFRDTFHAREELVVRIGYAPAVRIRANGKRVQLPSDTSVYEATFVAGEDGRVDVVPVIPT